MVKDGDGTVLTFGGTGDARLEGSPEYVIRDVIDQRRQCTAIGTGAQAPDDAQGGRHGG